MGTVDLLVAIGDDEQHRQRLHAPADEPHDVERRLVGPVQILQAQDGRTRGLQLGHKSGGDIVGPGAAIQLARSSPSMARAMSSNGPAAAG